MTEQTTSQKIPEKKGSILTKIILLIALIGGGLVAVKLWQKGSEQTKPEQGLDQEIIGLVEGYSDQSEQEDLSDLGINDLREKGAEFIYQMLLKNQLKIEDLSAQLQALKSEVLKYRSQEKLGKMILVYVDLREKILSEKVCSEEMKSFEILSASDEVLTAKIAKLKPLLLSFASQKKLEKNFAEIIPELIINKKNSVANESLIAKIQRNISRLIVLRRIDEKNPQEIDAIVVRIEKLLKQENYSDAFSAALSLPADYNPILKNFLDELHASLEVKQIDQEILNYLKSLN
jgi:hypothetical protein